MEQPLSALSFDNTEDAFAYKTDKALRKAGWIFSAMHYPWLVKAGSRFIRMALKAGLPVTGLIRETLFAQFCGGESLEGAGRTAGKLGQFGVGAALDYGVEAAEGEENYDRAVPEFIRAIHYASGQPNIPFISIKITGFSRFGLLEKKHSGAALSVAEQQEWERIRKRIYAVCKAAASKKTGVLIDAEESWIQQAVDELADEMMSTFNQLEPIVYNTFQLYRHDRLSFLEESFEKSRHAGYILGAKLVRGAYLEKERKRAAALGYPSPIQPDKAATDRDYNQAVRFCIGHLEGLSLFMGTHNEESCLLGVAQMQEKGLPASHPHVHFSQLYGMSDNITFNLAKAGFRVSKYLPYGPVKEVLPYLIRRAQENTSIAGQTGRELGLIRKEIRRRKASIVSSQ
ncbi:proline dehydrogenase family protein [Compostibacter hankyongensis]|uniref:Proline dehydrogenase family protein n=1 Tax=Compostibacter hankyongensis TaxID=1007089 RepID=A0ABP8G8G1_9BACT